MKPETRSWLGIVLVATLMATIATLSAHGRDDDRRVYDFEICEDQNENTSLDQLSPSHCLEGHGCVICEEQAFGELVSEDGQGQAKFLGMPTNCGGSRLIGTCVSNGSGGQNCDLSMAYVDGTCTGAVTNYADQAR